MAAMSGPLPPASEFAAYEQVLPGAANRIMKLAEDSLRAEIEGNQALRDIYREDRKTENWVFKFVSTVFSLTTVCAFAYSVVFFALGMNVAAYISFASTIGLLLPRTIEAFKGKKDNDSES